MARAEYDGTYRIRYFKFPVAGNPEHVMWILTSIIGTKHSTGTRMKKKTHHFIKMFRSSRWHRTPKGTVIRDKRVNSVPAEKDRFPQGFPYMIRKYRDTAHTGHGVMVTNPESGMAQ